MTQFLLRLFHCADGSPEDSRYRMKIGRLSGLTGIFCNALLCMLKLLTGILSGSVSIMADAMNNLSDAASSVVTLIGFRLSERPADKKHPYGHARYEYLSGLAVSAMILLIGMELVKTSFGKILHPESVDFSVPAAVVLLGSIAVKLWLARFNHALGSGIGSSALLATAADSRSDCLATAAVLAAGLMESLTSWKIDGFVGLIAAGFILCNGVSMGMETISPLLGEASNPELRDAITGLIMDCPKVLGFHDLMVHDYGPSQRFASIHVEMDSREDPMESHELIDRLERACLEQLHVELVIHYDPVVVGDPIVDETREEVVAVLHEFDPRLSIHDFRMVSGRQRTNLIFDAVLPVDLQGREEEIRDYVQKQMSSPEKGTYYPVITFDSEFFNNR